MELAFEGGKTLKEAGVRAGAPALKSFGSQKCIVMCHVLLKPDIENPSGFITLSARISEKG